MKTGKNTTDKNSRKRSEAHIAELETDRTPSREILSFLQTKTLSVLYAHVSIGSNEMAV